MTLVSDAQRIFRAGVAAADPTQAVRNHLTREGQRIRFGAYSLRLPREAEVRVVAIGKAAAAMADAAARTLGRRSTSLSVTPMGYPGSRRGLPILYGNHPVPRKASFRAGRSVLEFVRAAREEDLLLFLISGGGSAVAEVPAAGLTGRDISRTTELLLASGAPIGAMNAVRRHLSRIKGGQLAVASAASRFASLAISDVVGDAPHEIASGPSVPDPSTFREALTAVRAHSLEGRLPPRVAHHLTEGARGRLAETPKPDDPRFRGAPFVLIGSNRRSVEAAVREASSLGYRTERIRRPIVGPTQPSAVRFGRRLLVGPSRAARALIGGGETTVVLGIHPGKGGRNQEFALGSARALAGQNALVLSAGTDGIDGPTDAAGGWVSGNTWTRASRLGVDIRRALERHAAYDALDRLGSLVRTGPTGTNVMDLHVGLVGPAVSRSREGSTTRGGAPSSRRRRS